MALHVLTIFWLVVLAIPAHAEHQELGGFGGGGDYGDYGGSLSPNSESRPSAPIGAIVPPTILEQFQPSLDWLQSNGPRPVGEQQGLPPEMLQQLQSMGLPQGL